MNPDFRNQTTHSDHRTQTTPAVLSAGTLTGDPVINETGEHLGQLEEIMLDLDSGRVVYAVISFGGILGLGNKLFAVPWQALRVDTERKAVIVNVSRELLEQAPGFDKDNWPDTSEHTWLYSSTTVTTLSGRKPHKWVVR
jgi:sporulation protein YlmC with PRC-barrel domain